MIKYFLFGLVLCVVFFGVKLASKPAVQIDPIVAVNNDLDSLLVGEVPEGEVAQPAQQNNTAANLGSGDTSTSTNSAFGNQASNVNTSPVPLWENSDDFTSIPDKFLSKGLNPQALKISQTGIKSLSKGDEISLAIPQLGQEYPLSVEKVRKHRNGDRTIQGHLKDTNLPYSVVITSGELTTYATINTPDGSYVMEAEGDQGWIMSVANLDYLIDTNQDDFQIPDLTGQ